MLIKLPDGSQVDLVVGSQVTILTAAFGDAEGLGPFAVVAFEGDTPDIQLSASVAPCDVGIIATVINKPVEVVNVTMPDGTVIPVAANLAPVIQAVIDSNQAQIEANKALMQKLSDVLSGAELKAMQAKLDEMTVARDVAEAFANKLRAALPAVQAAEAALAEEEALLKG